MRTETLRDTVVQYSYDLSGNRTRKIVGGTAYSNIVSPAERFLQAYQF